MKRKLMKRIVAICVAAVVLGVLCIFLFKPEKGGEITLEQTKASIGDIGVCITATGTIEPTNQVEVGTQVSGKIAKLYVDYNSSVKQGQILAELDKEILQNELYSAQSALESARIEYEYQQKNYNRSKVLYQQKLISDSEYDEALYNYQKSKTEYERSKTELSKAKTNLGYATIYSPIDGTVISKAVEEGQTVAASFSTPTLFTIAQDLTQMQVVADVDEADIGGVQEGQRVTFSVDAYPRVTFEGTVKQVRLEGIENSNVITYEVIIDAPNANLKLKPGLTANVSIYTQEANGVLTVPTKALSFTPDKEIIGKKYKINPIPANEADSKHVWILNGNSLYAKKVEVGISGNGSCQIVAGLEKGETIVSGIMSKDVAVKEDAAQGAFSMPRPGDKKKK